MVKHVIVFHGKSYNWSYDKFSQVAVENFFMDKFGNQIKKPFSVILQSYTEFAEGSPYYCWAQYVVRDLFESPIIVEVFTK